MLPLVPLSVTCGRTLRGADSALAWGPARENSRREPAPSAAVRLSEKRSGKLGCGLHDGSPVATISIKRNEGTFVIEVPCRLHTTRVGRFYSLSYAGILTKRD